MAQPSLTDLITGFDPTSQSTITGAELALMVNNAQPYTDKGLILANADAAGVPQIPDAVTNPKWQNYLWLRLVPLSNSFALYAWNPNQTYILAYTGGTVNTNWNPVQIGAIPADSIQGYQLAPSTVTFDKIATIQISQVTGFSPANYVSTTQEPAAGYISGDFTTGLVINNGTITGVLIAPNTIAGGNIVLKSVAVGNLLGGTLNQLPFTVDGANTVAWTTPNEIVTEPAGIIAKAGNALKVPQVNAGSTAFQMAVLPIVTKAIVDNVAIPATTTTAMIAHTLTGIPFHFRVVLHCTTNDASSSFVVGDEIDLISTLATQGLANTSVFQIQVDATNVYILRGASASVKVLKKTNGTAVVVSAETNFVLKLYAVQFA